MEPPADSAALSLRSLYDAWFGEVIRWIRALGGPDCDVEDLAQEVFIVVQRRLAQFDGANVAGWLYRIAANTVRDRRQRAWVRRVILRRPDHELEGLPARTRGPAELLEEKEARRRLHGLLAKLSEKRRTVFVLFELEGYSGEEIAALQGIPVATVWTRLHHARRELAARAARLRRQEAQE
ncbi:MAG TPA: sigma-70 family RNA polymerase sigma factor [Polyangia bacterium]